MPDYKILFKPIEIGSMKVKNRFVVPAMGTELCNPDGSVSQRLIDYWSTKAKGGYGFLIVEYANVDPLGKAAPLQLGIWKDEFIPGLKSLTDEIHKNDVKVAVQLHHAGRETISYITGSQPVAPSPVPCPRLKEMPRELSTKEVYELIEKFGDAALRAKRAGFDAVETHGAHGYLVAQFISAYANKRTDEFGGSFSDRMRFATEIIKNIKKKAGNDFPVCFRISGDERVPGGRTIEESKIAAKALEEAGADMLNVSTGVYASAPWIIAPAAVPPGYNAGAAAEIKKSVQIPVMAVGRINHPALAADILHTGMADLIALGRESLADPEFPNKVAEGRVNEIAPCIGCLQRCNNGGVGVDENDTGVSCLVNPFIGKEGILKINKAETPKKIIVVGAGPAGLEAAWISAQRGHAVTVYEKESKAGGQYRVASIPPYKQDITKAIKYFIEMGNKYGVDYQWEAEATAEMIAAQKPDSVVLATGGVPLIPNIEGIDSPKVLNAVDVIDGKTVTGKKVLVVGGGMVGAECADLLGEHGHEVTIIEMLPQIANDEPDAPKFFLLERLKNYGVTVLTNAKVKTIYDDGALFEKDGTEQKILGFDSIVLALGAQAYNPLETELRSKGIDVHVIGDALKARTALTAILDAARVAVQL